MDILYRNKIALHLGSSEGLELKSHLGVESGIPHTSWLGLRPSDPRPLCWTRNSLGLGTGNMASNRLVSTTAYCHIQYHSFPSN
jgi:hypothetical protein